MGYVIILGFLLMCGMANADQTEPDCVVHVTAKTVTERAIFNDLSEATKYAKENNGQIYKLDTEDSWYVEYTVLEARSNLFDDCK